jgi:hypothetical protein
MSDRIHEIKTIADELIRRIQNWAADESPEKHIPPDIALIIERADMECNSGDIPKSCQQLVADIGRLMVEQNKYDSNADQKSRMHDGSPTSAWWAAARVVIKSRQGVEKPTIYRRESVKILLQQNVSRMQIAGAIYGRRGVGPLMQSNGVPDDFLIDQEAGEPGSVLKGWPDWVPPWETELQAESKAVVDRQLQALDRRENGKQYRDPATIEQMLRDKCYVQQIMRGKGVTRDDVMKVANALEIDAKDQPGCEPDLIGSMLDEDSVRTPFDKETRDQKTAESERAVAIWKENPSFGSAEIAEALRAEGIEMTVRAVGNAISWSKRKDKTAATVAE